MFVAYHRAAVLRPMRERNVLTHWPGESAPWKNRADFITPNQDAKPQKTGRFSELGHVRILTGRLQLRCLIRFISCLTHG
jgi:hypothetical protein